MDKEGKAYKSGEYADWFEASEVNSLCEEEYVRYGESLLACRDAQDGIRYAADQSFKEVELKGRREGELKGRREGKLSAFKSIIRNLKQNGFGLSDICRLTNLPETEVRSILAEI